MRLLSVNFVSFFCTIYFNFKRLSRYCAMLLLCISCVATAQTMTVTAQVQGTSVVLNWSAVPTAAAYMIDRNGRTIGSASNTVTTYTDNTIQLGQTYTYVIHPYYANGAGSATSSPVSISVGSFNYSTQAPSDFQHTLSDLNIPNLSNLTPVAITQGSSSVSNGAFGYKVSIDAPPGINNHAPSLAISYNSRVGDGLLGVGWTLSGMSSIRRCAPTIASSNDGISDPGSSTDDLCMDGQHLILKGHVNNHTVSRAAYWAPGATYVTELNNLTEIIAQGNGYEPGTFIVKTKKGETYYFGEANRNAKIYLKDNPSEGTESWFLTRVVDRYNNEYNIYYDYNSDTGEHLPNRIVYAPGAAIVFNYTARYGQIPWGSKDIKLFRHPKVLESIETYINVQNFDFPQSATPVRRYAIEYKQSNNTDRSLVDTIKECGRSGTVWKCAKPIQFDYETSSFSVGASVSIGMDVAQLVDIDGDEYVDALLKNGDVAWGQANGQFIKTEWVSSQSENGGNHVFSGVKPFRTSSGLAIIGLKTEPYAKRQSIFFIHSINKNNQTKVETYLVSQDSTDAGMFVVGDDDCDGMDDLYYRGQWYRQAESGFPTNWQINTQVSGFKAEAQVTMVNWANPCSIKFPVAAHANFDKQWLGNDPEFSYGAWFHNYKASEVTNTSKTTRQFHTLVDLNGDGYKELIVNRSLGTSGTLPLKWVYRLGHELFTMNAEQDLVGSDNAEKQCFTSAYDYDKDGREDFLAVYNGSLQVFLARDVNGQSARLSQPIPLGINFYGLELCSSTQRMTNIFTGDANNDGIADFVGGGVSHSVTQKQPDLLTKITNGFGAEIKIDYSTLSSEVYTPASVKPQFPYAPASRNMWVVKTLSTINGQGGYNNTQYRYQGAKTHLQGRGFLGFEKITVTDEAKSVISITDYHQEWPLIGKIKQQISQDTSGKLISIKNNDYTANTGNGTFVYAQRQVQKTFELLTTSVDFPVSTQVIESNIDACGNPAWQIQRVGSNYTNGVLSGELNRVESVNTIDSGLSGCLDDFIDQTTISYTANGETKITTTDFDKNTQGDIGGRTDFLGTEIQRTTTINRNANGIVTSISEAAKDIGNTNAATRTTSFDTLEANAWPKRSLNALNQITHFGYDKRFGVVNNQSDLFTNITTQYDELGRAISVKSKDNTLTESISFYCAEISSLTCPSGAIYGVATRVTNVGAVNYLGAPLSIVFYDKLQREIRSVVYGFNGNTVNKAIEYNADGSVYRVSEPYMTYGIQSGVFANAWTTYSGYDALGRPSTVTPAAGGSVTTSREVYGAGIRTTQSTLVVSANSNQTQTSQTITNALGQVTRSIDAIGGFVDYTYDAQGNLKTTIVNNNSLTTVSLTHDLAGNKTFINDPDAKSIQFEYNGFGELRRQTWQPNLPAARKSLTFTYDNLGRKTQRVDTGPGISGSYSWTYDQNNQPGMLTGRSGGGLTDTYVYNGYGQLQSTTHTLDGKTYNFGYQYDVFGRLIQNTSPNNYLATQREYSAQGFQVRTLGKVGNNTPRVLWALGKTQDSRGEFIQELLGNGVVTKRSIDAATGLTKQIRSGRLTSYNTIANLSGDIQSLGFDYDSIGNLRYRESKRTGMDGTATLENLTETLTYDSLNRLDISTGTGTYRRNYDYDGLGNLTYREDKSSSRSNSPNTDIGSLLYENVRNAGPHAVTYAAGQTYSYDLYGNMTQRGTDSITYDILNKPTRINGGTVSDFVYDADHQLVKQVVNGVTTVYLGNVEIILEGLTTTTSTYIDGAVQYRYFNNGVTGASGEYHYLHRDNLGSVDAVSSGAGYFKSRMSFDAWGNRRLDTWSRGTPTITSPTKRGYTGHEQLDQHKLVHMQGRVYDPVLGRFLSADPYIQAPHNTQSYNRYSYVFNNPLSFVDPTGHQATNTPGQHGPAVEEVLVIGYMPDYSNLSSQFDISFSMAYLSMDFSQAFMDFENITTQEINVPYPATENTVSDEKLQLIARQQQILFGTNFLTNPKQNNSSSGKNGNGVGLSQGGHYITLYTQEKNIKTKELSNPKYKLLMNVFTDVGGVMGISRWEKTQTIGRQFEYRSLVLSYGGENVLSMGWTGWQMKREVLVDREFGIGSAIRWHTGRNMEAGDYFMSTNPWDSTHRVVGPMNTSGDLLDGVRE